MSDKGVLEFSSTQRRSQGEALGSTKAILVPSWQRARDLSCSALLAGEMCVVVTGLPGTGKTLLVDTVARALRSTGWTIVILAARLPSDAEFAALTGSAAILIDDADRLSATELRSLNRLRQCSVLLAGAVGLEKRCPADSRVTLTPLPLDEVTIHVGSWLEQGGLSPDLVTPAAIAHLTDVSAGIPRVLNMLLADSLRGARAEGSDQIEEHHIDNAAWHHVEHTAARRINRAISTSVPKSAKPTQAQSDADLERRLSQAPFADPPVVDESSQLVSFRALGFAGAGLAIGLAAGLVTAAGLAKLPRWSQWAASTYDSIVPNRDAPAVVPAAPVVTAAAPAVDQPETIEVESVPPASIVPSAPPAAPMPPDPVPPVPDPGLQASPPPGPPPSPEVVESRPAQSAPPDIAPAVPPLPLNAGSEPLSPAVIKLLNDRGQQMVELNDYSAARLLFSRAAASGSVRAMLSLGRTYDPGVIGTLASAAGADPAQAAQWYRKAAALGSSDAAIFLQQLERDPRE